MKKIGHIIFAFLLCFGFILLAGAFGWDWFNFSAKSVVIMCLIILLYSLLPDIDHKNSTVTWWFIGFSIIGLIWGLLVLIMRQNYNRGLLLIGISIVFLLAIYFCTNYFKHRGIIHSILIGILVSIPLYFIFFFEVQYAIIGFVAWYSHLLADGYLFKIV
jgi:membrane-bound metal-dependent hydrolase YbcI (DUF457 family)